MTPKTASILSLLNDIKNGDVALPEHFKEFVEKRRVVIFDRVKDFLGR